MGTFDVTAGGWHTDPTGEETILEEAERLVGGDRNRDYGHPTDDFAALGRMWGAILTRAFKRGGDGADLYVPDVPAETVGLMLAALKINREAGKHKRDNLVDLSGYGRCVDRIHRRREGLE